MKKFHFIQGLKIFVFVVLAMFAFGYVTMMLWNWLMPEIFDLPVISYWQAIGLLVLSKIFFGLGKGGKKGCNNSCGSGGGHLGWKEKMKSRMENMTDEEKEKMKNRCGGIFKDLHDDC